jgi:hypothetical protein
MFEVKENHLCILTDAVSFLQMKICAGTEPLGKSDEYNTIHCLYISRLTDPKQITVKSKATLVTGNTGP